MRYKEKLLLPLFFILAICFALPAVAQDKPELKLGGALRFNYNYSDWKPSNRKRGGDFGFDVFRLNVDAAYKKLTLAAEYRFYASFSGGGMLKSGWVGYQFNDMHQLQVGLAPVPFGIQPYTSNSYFFNINYYLGLEDDSDMGIKYLYRKGGWEMAFAFFKNADVLDFGDQSEVSPDRYAYDVAGRNKEVNQGNAQVIYHWGKKWKQQIGGSAMYGGLYNLDTEKMGARSAFALHYMLDVNRWNLKAQYTNYQMRPKNLEGEDRRTVSVAAYGAPYQIAAKASTYSATLSYTIPIYKGVLDEIRLYNDFSMMDKRDKEFNDSYQNVTGCMLSMGSVYTYVDYAMGKNHSWLGSDWDNAFADGIASNHWNVRFNINIGYYF